MGKLTAEGLGSLPPPDHFLVRVTNSPTTHLVRGIKVASVVSQALHNVVVAPGGGCQEGRLSFSVLNVHVAASFAQGFGHRVVAVPGSTVQRGLFFLPRRQGQQLRESAGQARVPAEPGSKVKAMGRERES